MYVLIESKFNGAWSKSTGAGAGPTGRWNLQLTRNADRRVLHDIDVVLIVPFLCV